MAKAEVIRQGQKKQILLSELLTPREDDPWEVLRFTCVDATAGPGCGQVEMTVNFRTGHVVDNSPGKEAEIFWVDTGGLTPEEYVRENGIDSLTSLVVRGHAANRHPKAETITLHSGE